ncbi:MAG: hypothetical protein JW778_02520 [Candidatus Altiarchaeota archaeon]|nr:hypothetical protein [Candidatus Altiarchaeota archaeon]
MKKLFIFAVMFLLALSITSADNETIEPPEENETVEPPEENQTVDEDVDAFGSVLGAEIRLLQLESALTKNILWGEEIVAAILGKNSSADVSELEAILAELQVLRNDVASTAPESGSESALLFVDLKKDAIDLTHEFRTIAQNMLKPNEADGLRRRLQLIKWDETKARNGRIHALQREYNAQKVNESLSTIGVSNPQLLDRVRAGNASLSEVKASLKAAIQNMGAYNKTQAMVALQENVARKNVFKRAVIEKVGYKKLERLQTRTENRIAAAQSLNLSEKTHARLENRLQKAIKKEERIQNRTEEEINRSEQVSEKTPSQAQVKGVNKSQNGNGNGVGGGRR